METTSSRHRAFSAAIVFIQLSSFWICTLVDSSPLPPTTTSLVTSSVGGQAVLPCSWKSLPEVATAPSLCHIQWATLADLVFERLGQKMWQAPEFKGRATVPEEKLGSGNCSLIISDVQIGDTGSYESFVVMDTTQNKGVRVFIQSVKLLVSDHKSIKSHHPGEDLVLELHTSHSYRVVFLSRNSSMWSEVWRREDKNDGRLEKHPVHEQVTIKNVQSSDEGIYKVIDEHGLAVSTVQLFIKEGTASPKTQDRLDYVPTDCAPKIGCSGLFLLSALISSVHILHHYLLLLL
ncbi:uncharacterized protein KZ484_006462 [Pholidichthys leucotaenia]